MSLVEFRDASGLPKGLIRNDPDLTGFGAKIAALNRTLPAPDMAALPFGRAYLNRDPDLSPGSSKFYAGKIHIAPIGEYNHPEALKYMEAHAAGNRPTLYMGAGGFINMSYIAATKPKAALLFDVNPLQMLFWNEVIDIIKQNEDVAGFLHSMRSIEHRMNYVIREQLGHVYFRGRGLYTGPDRADYNPLRETTPEFYFLESMNPVRDEDWWKKQDYYDHLHQMAKADAIGAITMDLFHTPSWQQLEQALPVRADIAYITNIMTHPGWTGRYDPESDTIRQTGWDHIFMAAKKEGRFINHNGVINLHKRNCIYAPQLGIGSVD